MSSHLKDFAKSESRTNIIWVNSLDVSWPKRKGKWGKYDNTIWLSGTILNYKKKDRNQISGLILLIKSHEGKLIWSFKPQLYGMSYIYDSNAISNWIMFPFYANSSLNVSKQDQKMWNCTQLILAETVFSYIFYLWNTLPIGVAFTLELVTFSNRRYPDMYTSEVVLYHKNIFNVNILIILQFHIVSGSCLFSWCVHHP